MQEWHDSQSHERVEYGHESCRTKNQEWLCLLGPEAIYQAQRNLVL